MPQLTLHLVSDATGATLQGLAEAALAQFDNAPVTQKLWPQIRSLRQIERVISGIESHSGPVFYTLVDDELIARLEDACAALGVACVPLMAPLLEALSVTLNKPPLCRPGLQHKMDDLYFKRMEAIDFAMSFDDGQHLTGIDTADVILVGVSRTSKTPTCVYLARHGVRAANIPLVPDVAFPSHVLELKRPLFVGLTESPDRLIALRATRLKLDMKAGLAMTNAYVDPEKVEAEVTAARKFFRQNGWPILDVTKRSVEETAAEIMVLLQDKEQNIQDEMAKVDGDKS